MSVKNAVKLAKVAAARAAVASAAAVGIGPVSHYVTHHCDFFLAFWLRFPSQPGAAPDITTAAAATAGAAAPGRATIAAAAARDVAASFAG